MEEKLCSLCFDPVEDPKKPAEEEELCSACRADEPEVEAEDNQDETSSEE